MARIGKAGTSSPDQAAKAPSKRPNPPAIFPPNLTRRDSRDSSSSSDGEWPWIYNREPAVKISRHGSEGHAGLAHITAAWFLVCELRLAGASVLLLEKNEASSKWK